MMVPCDCADREWSDEEVRRALRRGGPLCTRCEDTQEVDVESEPLPPLDTDALTGVQGYAPQGHVETKPIRWDETFDGRRMSERELEAEDWRRR